MARRSSHTKYRTYETASQDNINDNDVEKIHEFSLPHVTLSPNPTEGMVTVAVNNVSTKAVTLTVVDQTGKVLQQNTVAVTGSVLQTELDLARMPSGIYFLKIQSGQAVRMERVVKF